MKDLITWFRTPWVGSTYSILGIYQDDDESAPGIQIDISGQLIDYYPNSGEHGQMQLFDLVPERPARISTPLLPSLSYAKGRVDWVEYTGHWTVYTDVAAALGTDISDLYTSATIEGCSNPQPDTSEEVSTGSV